MCHATITWKQNSLPTEASPDSGSAHKQQHGHGSVGTNDESAIRYRTPMTGVKLKKLAGDCEDGVQQGANGVSCKAGQRGFQGDGNIGGRDRVIEG